MKVISGGQTGVDRYALEIARSIGLPTGGMAPKNYRTDDGNDYSLRDFGVEECNIWGYPYRTEHNVKHSDLTALFGDVKSAGCKLTIKYCKMHGKPYLINPSSEMLRNYIILYGVNTLNVAGNREKSLSPEQQEKIKRTLKDTFQYFIKEC